MLSCKEVLARHSEYLDGEMAPLDLERWRAHLAECALCARYDRVLRKGVRMLADRPAVEPDPTFKLHLRYRLADEERRSQLRPVTMNAAASVSVAAVLALVAWLPIMVLARGDERAPAAAVTSLSTTDQRASEIAWHGGHGMSERHAHDKPSVTLNHTTTAASLIGRRYTPLIVEPPTAPPTYTRVSLTSLEAY